MGWMDNEQQQQTGNAQFNQEAQRRVHAIRVGNGTGFIHRSIFDKPPVENQNTDDKNKDDGGIESGN